jgi:hypothetical protein
MPTILPPITYSFPLATAEAAWCRAVGIGTFDVQVSDRGS